MQFDDLKVVDFSKVLALVDSMTVPQLFSLRDILNEKLSVQRLFGKTQQTQGGELLPTCLIFSGDTVADSCCFKLLRRPLVDDHAGYLCVRDH